MSLSLSFCFISTKVATFVSSYDVVVLLHRSCFAQRLCPTYQLFVIASNMIACKIHEINDLDQELCSDSLSFVNYYILQIY
jgi:hypothetical protein